MSRSSTLNAAVYQLLRRSNQIFFLGPNIEAVRYSADKRWKFEFLHTRFSTVAVDTFDLTRIKNKEERLTQELKSKGNWPALVFISSPDRANSLATTLTEDITFAEVSDMSEWIDENFGDGWELSKSVAAGVAVHHGRIPRSLASQFVRMFNSGELPILICTSTLIEGVNTAAKSVLIYDKQIARRDYDFFTFSNIEVVPAGSASITLAPCTSSMHLLIKRRSRSNRHCSAISMKLLTSWSSTYPMKIALLQ